MLFFTPRYRSNFVQGYFPCRRHEEEGQLSPRTPESLCRARDGALPSAKRAGCRGAARDTAEQGQKAASGGERTDNSLSSRPSGERRDQDEQSDARQPQAQDECVRPPSLVKPSDHPPDTANEPNPDPAAQKAGAGDVSAQQAEAKTTAVPENPSADNPPEAQQGEQGRLLRVSPFATAGGAALIPDTEPCSPVSYVPAPACAASQERTVSPSNRGCQSNAAADAVLVRASEGECSRRESAALNKPSSTAQFSSGPSQLKGSAGVETQEECSQAGDVVQGGTDTEESVSQGLCLYVDAGRTHEQSSSGVQEADGMKLEGESIAGVRREVPEKTGNHEKALRSSSPQGENYTVLESDPTGLCFPEAEKQETSLHDVGTGTEDTAVCPSLPVPLDQEHVPGSDEPVNPVPHEDLPSQHDPRECSVAKQPVPETEQASAAMESELSQQESTSESPASGL